MNDELSITANGVTIQGWQSITVTRSIEQFPSSFQVGFTEKYPQSDRHVVIIPGTPCEVKIGGELILTGFIDRYNSSITPQTHEVSMQGRSRCEDIADASAYFGEQGSGNTVLFNVHITEVATQLCAPFGIKVTNRADDGPEVFELDINLGETPYEIIEKMARYVGLLVYDDVDGNLILDRVGTTSMGSGLQQGVNVQQANVTFACDQRFSDYYVVWQPTNSQNDITHGNQYNVHGYASDPELLKLDRFRPRYIVSQVWDVKLGDMAQRVADWEANRRWGRSQAVTVTTDSWRDSKGKLWRPNALVSVNIPIIKASNLNWVIGTVVYSRTLETGTTATLTLYPKLAFDIEPLSINTQDNVDILSKMKTGPADSSGSPTPPDQSYPTIAGGKPSSSIAEPGDSSGSGSSRTSVSGPLGNKPDLQS